MNHIQKFLFIFLFVSNISHAVDPQRLFLLEAALVLAPAANEQQSPPANPFEGKRRKLRSPEQTKFNRRTVMHRLMQPPRK